MKTYVKPDIEVTVFALNDAVAANGCVHVDSTGPQAVTVSCIIGGQEETVFLSDNTSCASKSSKHAIVKNYTYAADGTTADYFVWYTGNNDPGTAPPDSATAKLNAVVNAVDDSQMAEADQFTAGPGYHYAVVNASGTAGYDTLTIS